MAELTREEFHREAKEFKAGEYVFINAASFSSDAIESLRKMIECGHLTPDNSIVEGLYVNPEKIMSGQKIILHMNYLVGTENFNNVLEYILKQEGKG